MDEAGTSREHGGDVEALTDNLRARPSFLENNHVDGMVRPSSRLFYPTIRNKQRPCIPLGPHRFHGGINPSGVTVEVRFEYSIHSHGKSIATAPMPAACSRLLTLIGDSHVTGRLLSKLAETCELKTVSIPKAQQLFAYLQMSPTVTVQVELCLTSYRPLTPGAHARTVLAGFSSSEPSKQPQVF